MTAYRESKSPSVRPIDELASLITLYPTTPSARKKVIFAKTVVVMNASTED